MDGSGAEYLASIFGTEKDKVNCSFYYKIGACRHGDRCSRVHNRPTFSQTILCTNLYINPALQSLNSESGEQVYMSEVEMQQHYDDFFNEVYSEIEEKYRVDFLKFMVRLIGIEGETTGPAFVVLFLRNFLNI